MKFAIHVFIGLTVAIAALTAPSPAVAASVSATYLEMLDSLQVRRTVGSTTSDLNVGIFHFRQTGGYDLPQGPDFYAFCVEPFETVASGTFTFAQLEKGNTLLGGMGVARANRIRELFTRYAPVIHADLLDSPITRALQIATWEIVRETSSTLNVLSGNIRFSHPTSDAANNAVRNAVYAQANTMLASLTGDPDDRLHNFYALTRVGNQDVIVFANPEPSTLVLMGCGALLVYVGRRRSQRRQ